MHILAEPSPIVMPPRAEDSAPTRQSLLMRLQRGDETAGWREFFDAYWELIYNVARNAGLNDSEAQEAVQETVIAVARKIGEFKTGPEHGSFKSWLLGQARWQIGNQFRARRRKKRLFDELPTLASDDRTATEPLHRVPDPAGRRFESLWDEEWERHVLRGALDRVKALVSVKQFQMFDLHVHQGLSVAETARAVGATMAAVYMAKSRVGRLLRREAKRLASQPK
jgi:RNA polymerase sigma factor (sigma-70 family)